MSSAQALAGVGDEAMGHSIQEVDHISARITVANIHYPVTMYLSLF